MRASGPPGAPDVLVVLGEALLAGRRVQLRYRDAAVPTSREVDVLGLGWREAGWVLACHWRRRRAFRLLRVDRILAARISRRRADAGPPEGFDPRFFAAAGILEPGGEALSAATVRLRPPLGRLAAVLFPAAPVERRPVGMALCRVRTSDVAALARLVSSLGDRADLLHRDRPLRMAGSLPPGGERSTSRGIDRLDDRA